MKLKGPRKGPDLLVPLKSQKLITAATPKRRGSPALKWTSSSLKCISWSPFPLWSHEEIAKWQNKTEDRQAEVRKLQVYSRKLEIPKGTSVLPLFSYSYTWAISKPSRETGQSLEMAITSSAL